MPASRRYVPLVAVIVYSAIFLSVLIKSLIWPVGDQTDVIHAGIAAFPLGLAVAFGYPGGREGAFVAVSVSAAINAAAIYLLARRWTRSAP